MTLTTTQRPETSLSPAEKNRRLDLVAAAYRSPANAAKTFMRIPGIEGMTDAERRATSTIGTLMQPAVDALNADGTATDSTLGALEDNLGLAPDEIHDLACACHGMAMAGSYMSGAVSAFKNGD